MAKYRWDMDDDVGKVLSYVLMGCPLCKEPFRTKTVLRVHLKRVHTIIELEKFLDDNE